jgi:hypothetical protein
MVLDRSPLGRAFVRVPPREYLHTLATNIGNRNSEEPRQHKGGGSLLEGPASRFVRPRIELGPSS